MTSPRPRCQPTAGVLPEMLGRVQLEPARPHPKRDQRTRRSLRKVGRPSSAQRSKFHFHHGSPLSLFFLFFCWFALQVLSPVPIVSILTSLESGSLFAFVFLAFNDSL